MRNPQHCTRWGTTSLCVLGRTSNGGAYRRHACCAQHSPVTLRDPRPLVLLAEDDDEMREVISARLIREGMRVVEVDDGFELRDYLVLCCSGADVQQPDVVVTDVRMPGENGPEALLHSHFHRSPVVLIGSCIDAEVRAYGARVGVVAIFEKPFPLSELIAAIRRVLVDKECTIVPTGHIAPIV